MDLTTRLLCMFLEKFHGISISLQTLKRPLSDHRLNKIGSDISDASLQMITESRWPITSKRRLFSGWAIDI